MRGGLPNRVVQDQSKLASDIATVLPMLVDTHNQGIWALVLIFRDICVKSRDQVYVYILSSAVSVL